MHISPHWAPSCDHGFWKTWARAEKRNIANVENLEIMKNLISPISDLGFRGRCGVGCRRTPLHVRNCAVGTRSLSSKSSAACKTRSPHQQCSSWFGHSNCVFRVPNQRRCMLKPTPRRPYAGPLLGTHSVSGVPLGVLTLRTHFTTSTCIYR